MFTPDREINPPNQDETVCECGNEKRKRDDFCDKCETKNEAMIQIQKLHEIIHSLQERLKEESLNPIEILELTMKLNQAKYELTQLCL